MRNPNTTCHGCNNPCYVRPSQLERQGAWFCSRICYSTWRTANVSGVCLECMGPYVATRSDRKYCSRKCSNEARRGIKYKVGNGGRMEVLDRIRAMLAERDGYRCGSIDCPSPEPIWKGKPLKIQVEHIDGNRKNNSPENLMFLCPNCHTQTVTYGVQKHRLPIGF